MMAEPTKPAPPVIKIETVIFFTKSAIEQAM